MYKRHINNAKWSVKSPHACGRRTPIGTPPINPFPQHRELRGRQPQSTVLGVWPRKAATFQNFVIKAEPLTVPVEQLDPISASPSESKHRTTRGLLMHYILCQCRQACDPFAHIRYAACQIHAHAGARTDHAVSTARISVVSATGSSVVSKCKRRSPRKRNSMAVGGGVSATEGCGTGKSAATGICNGKKIAPASGDHKPFFFNSCRHL